MRSSTWSVERKSVAKATRVKVGLAPVVDGFELSVDVELTTYEWEGWREPTTRGLEIVPTGARVMLRIQQGERDLGRLVADPGAPFVVGMNAGHATITYVARLSALALQRFDDLRDGQAVDVAVTAFGLAFVGSGSYGRGGVLVQEVLELDLVEKIAGDTWHEMLVQAGVTSSIHLEIPVPSQHDFPELKRALEHLRDAIEERARGKDENAITACRNAIDELKQREFGGHAPQDVIEFLKQNAKRLTMSERYSMMQACMFLALSPASHGGPTRDDLGRLDSKYAITSLAALLAWAPFRGRRSPDLSDDATMSNRTLAELLKEIGTKDAKKVFVWPPPYEKDAPPRPKDQEYAAGVPSGDGSAPPNEIGVSASERETLKNAGATMGHWQPA